MSAASSASAPGTWLLYGANGFTGRLIAAEAKERELSPILAGRDELAVGGLAEELGLPWRVFRLDDPVGLARGIDGVRAVLLAAGPFSRTSEPVVEMCLAEGVHYLDITGEIPVLEAIFGRDGEARRRHVALLPGVGFGVVATDCLAASLARELPGADRLVLAFASPDGGPSAGTAKAILETFSHGGAIRREGRLVEVPLGWRSTVVPFEDRPRRAVSVPWGDVATAHRSTGIPNVVTLAAVPRLGAAGFRLLGPAAPLLRLGPVRRAAQRTIERFVTGPDEETRRTGRCRLWGRATHPDGRRVEGTATTPEGYRFTAVAAVECARRVAADPASFRGAQTPSRAFGHGLLAELPGCDLRVGEVAQSD